MAKYQKIVTTEKTTGSDWFKWLLAITILVAGIVANYYYITEPAPIRIALGLVLCCVVLGILATTAQGGRSWKFLQSARLEMRKVVWPTRQETVRMSFIVIVIVVILSFIMWGIDTGFMALIRWITLS